MFWLVIDMSFYDYTGDKYLFRLHFNGPKHAKGDDWSHVTYSNFTNLDRKIDKHTKQGGSLDMVDINITKPNGAISCVTTFYMDK